MAPRQNKTYDAIVVICRTQPVTLGHLAQFLRALDEGETLVALCGSSNRIRGQRNPWTYEERKAMIIAAIQNARPNVDMNRVRILPLPDRVYDLTAWLTQVHSLVQHATFDRIAPRIAIAGHDADNSAAYRDLFPRWDYLPMPGAKEIEATAVRERYLGGGVNLTEWFPQHVPETTIEFLHKFRGAHAYVELLDDRQAIAENKAKYGEGPFVAGDAMLVHAGEVLLIERGKRPNIGSWALPGGFMEASKGETLYDCAVRELFEETNIGASGLTPRDLASFYRGRDIFDDPYRSERGTIISGAFIFELPAAYAPPEVKGMDDAQHAFWKPISEIDPTKMFDDHAAIIETLLPKLQNPKGR